MVEYDYYYITDEHLEIANNNGIKPYVVRDRVYKLGWSIKRAITEKARTNNKIPKDIEENLIKYNIKRKTYLSRINYGWDTIKASTTKPIKGKERALRAVNERDKNAKLRIKDVEEIIDKNNLSDKLVRNRVYNLRWSVEKAINTPKRLKRDNKKHIFRKYNSQIYINVNG